MKIITRGEGLSGYSEVEGSLSLDAIGGVLWTKLNTRDGKQYITAFNNKYEKAELLAILLKDKDAVDTCKRNGWWKENERRS